jgi:predicted nucleotidyltransferase
MKTPLLDQALRAQAERRERDRQHALQQTLAWLDQHGRAYGIAEAYIFGSVLRSGQFQAGSDVDVAVVQIDSRRYFEAIGVLAAWVGREVDIIELQKCPFRHRIQEYGLRWTAPTD